MIGAHVLSDLGKQREQIERNLHALHTTQSHLDTSNRTMNTMIRRYTLFLETINYNTILFSPFKSFNLSLFKWGFLFF